MKIYKSVASFNPLPYAVVTSGTFDGIHYGHQRIIERVREIAKQYNGDSVVITYWPHPRYVLNPENTTLKLLTTLEEKIELLDSFGIDHLLVVPFDKEFAEMSSKTFIEEIIVKKINTKKLVIGYDHKFGKNREGSFEFIKANAHLYGIEIEEIPKQEIDEVAVSSTKIREALIAGQVSLANKFLCHPYTITGKVIKGNQIGRLISFPTANLSVDNPHKLIPADGIYAVRVRYLRQWYNGMLNIGYRPTVENALEKTIEVHIFDFNQTIYGETITVAFIEYLRAEQKFASLDALREQLLHDEQRARKILEG